jgi:dTDP-4-dehydrorhamnose 3,5-epimerase
MKFIKTAVPDVVIIEPTIFEDERGYFFESYRQDLFEQEIGKIDFIQENESKSIRGTLRGLHYQLPPFAQSKLVRVTEGTVLDVAVDIRKDSPYFSKYVAIELSAKNKRQLFIPKGFAHGYLVLSEIALFQYKTDNYYSKSSERGILFNDSFLNIDWGNNDGFTFLLSEKDKLNSSFKKADIFE